MTAPISRASRSSQASQVDALAQERNAQLSLSKVWPYIEKYAKQYGADPKVLAGIINQESGFKNYGVHFDGTGHGLIGLDDNGLLPDFEKWSGKSFGRGANAKTIPPELQVEYLAKTIGSMGKTYGSDFAAARAWHRGGGAMNDARGQHYEALIRGHINKLFPGGKTPEGGEIPDSEAPSKPGQKARPPASEADGGGTSKAGSAYTIRRGDTLWAIADRLKSQGMPGGHWDIIHDIQKLNPKITDPNLIIAGDSLKLPGVNGAFRSDDMSTGTGKALRDGATKLGGVPPRQDDGPAAGSKAEQILETARKFLGTHEGSNNSNPFSAALGRPPEAWCADFVSYCAKKAGLSLNTASAQGVQDFLESRGAWKGKHNPQPGDALTFRWDGSGGWADHVGMVEKIYQRNGQIYIDTIEGNSSDQVRRKTYAMNDPVIKGFGTIR